MTLTSSVRSSRATGSEIAYERLVDKEGRTVRYGNVVYANLTLSGKSMPIYRYEDSKGNVDYYGPDGQSVRKALLQTPIDGARISSGFGMRHHPVLGYSKMHKGVDFAARRGTPVMAAGDGIVERASRFGSYGNYIRIRHNSTYKTAYAHLKGFAKGIRKGVRVRQGQIIGYVGTTGRSTGPHLHYEVLANNKQVNPKSAKLPAGRKLAGKELKTFQAQLAETTTRIAALREKGDARSSPAIRRRAISGARPPRRIFGMNSCKPRRISAGFLFQRSLFLAAILH